ncbi:MAG: dicarboxylate/amino acid:cation symporter [bacterium]|nr:dicarboxylate/amino acid:cation symporter [bacterium]
MYPNTGDTLKNLKSIPAYFWTLLALILGIILGGFFPEGLFSAIASGTTSAIRFVVKLVPILIFAALAPSCATLVKRGLAGRFATSVVGWFVLSSALAGLIGVIVSGIIFNIPFSGKETGVWAEIVQMFRSLAEESGASLPLIAILVSVLTGIAAVWISPLFSFLSKIEKGIGKAGQALGYVLIPVLFCLGVTIGVKFGPRIGMGHFFTVVIYTFVLCLAWSVFYILVITKIFTKTSIKELLTVYFFPTAIFAMGTISSLVTLPINLTNIKRLGVRDEVADFIIPFGAVTNMDGSAVMNVAFIPILLSLIFGVDISWTMMLIIWPVVIVFTIAAPGLPAGMGSSLWTATLVSSMLGFEDPLRSTFITTFVAFYGGVPDMFVTTTNCTGDGLTAVLFNSKFDKYLKKDKNQKSGNH